MAKNQVKLLEACSPRQKKIHNYVVNKQWDLPRIAEKLSTPEKTIKRCTISREMGLMRQMGIELPDGRALKKGGKKTSKTVARTPSVEIVPGNPYEEQFKNVLPQDDKRSDKAIVIIGGSEALGKILANLSI